MMPCAAVTSSVPNSRLYGHPPPRQPQEVGRTFSSFRFVTRKNVYFNRSAERKMNVKNRRYTVTWNHVLFHQSHDKLCVVCGNTQGRLNRVLCDRDATGFSVNYSHVTKLLHSVCLTCEHHTIWTIFSAFQSVKRITHNALRILFLN